MIHMDKIEAYTTPSSVVPFNRFGTKPLRKFYCFFVKRVMARISLQYALKMLAKADRIWY